MRGNTLARVGLVLLATSPRIAHAAGCAAAYAQCGGTGYSGPTCCVSGYACQPTSSAYSMCSFGTTAPTPTTTTATPAPTSTTKKPGKTKKPKTTKPSKTKTTKPTPTPTPNPSGAYVTYVDVTVAEHQQVYPTADKSQCGVLTLVDNVCCPSYCASNNMSDSCKDCSGACVTPKSEDCASGLWGETTTVGDNEPWHFSRSTHYGITTAGACGFGYYGLCTKGSKTASWTDAWLGATCDAFCKAYPVLCQDPKDITLRGNFAAPDGKYYSQFWPHLAGDRDNYLSCGECFELVRTKKDGSDYKVGEKGYTDPIVLEITDSCPCTANSKWCCGSGDDHCGEIDFKYGCPIPQGSTHLDLSDIAMGRLQGNGTIQDGVIPTRYRRVPCPKPGNIYVWMQQVGPYYFALGIVNTAGVGGVAKVEIKGAGMDKWMPMQHNPDYPSGHPQERYGSWTVLRDTGPYNVPIGMRITSPNGEQVVNENVITTFTIPDTAPPGAWYIDFGAQFTKNGKP